VAGYVMAELGHVPQIGEAVDVAGYRLTVDELDGRRVARVRISRTGPGVPEAGERSEAAQAAGADGLEQ